MKIRFTKAMTFFVIILSSVFSFANASEISELMNKINYHFRIINRCVIDQNLGAYPASHAEQMFELFMKLKSIPVDVTMFDKKINEEKAGLNLSEMELNGLRGSKLKRWYRYIDSSITETESLIKYLNWLDFHVSWGIVDELAKIRDRAHFEFFPSVENGPVRPREPVECAPFSGY